MDIAQAQKRRLFTFDDGFKWVIADQAPMPACPQCRSTDIVVMASMGVVHGYCTSCGTHLVPEGSSIITRGDIGGAIRESQAGTDRGTLPTRPPVCDGD